MTAADSLLALGIVIAFAALLGAWASFFRLPLIIAYILAGLILGPFVLKNSHTETFALLRDLGLSFLLFLVGLEIKTSELKNFGKQSLIVGSVQIVAISIITFFLALALGFSVGSAVFVAIALSFSSTVIVVKLLTEKRDLDSLYGKLAISILLIQDVAAIFILILIPALGGGKFSFSKFIITILVGLVLVSLIYFFSKKVLPYLFERMARNLELLFLTSLAWLLLIAAISAKFGFSVEIGAFLAGLGLASLKEEHQIAARIRPLRDFFIVIFFILLGSQILTGFSLSILAIALVLSVFILLLKPLIVLVVMGRLGFKRRTGFMTGVSIAQVSEFSLIIMFLGLKEGLIGQNIVSVVTLTAFITIATSAYLSVFATKIYRRLEKFLKFSEVPGSKIEETGEMTLLENHVVLVGCNRLGWEVLKQLQKQDKQILVVDFNPTIIKALQELKVEYLFGDVTDPDIWQQANIAKASIVISTVFDPDDTLELLSNIRTLASKPIVFVTAAEREWAMKFYQEGADYVIVPRILSGHQVAHLLTEQKLSEIREGRMKTDHLEELRSALDKLSLGN